jgi:hypothetical protein
MSNIERGQRRLLHARSVSIKGYDPNIVVSEGGSREMYHSPFVMSHERRRRTGFDRKRWQRRIKVLASSAILACLGVGSGCSSTAPSEDQEVSRPRAAPLPATRRTPRVNAFGHPIYESAGPVPLEHVQSIEETVGRSQSELEEFLGPPTGMVRDGDIRILRYRGAQCSVAFFLYLDTEGRRVVAFAKHEWHGTTRARSRSCLLSLAKARRTNAASADKS